MPDNRVAANLDHRLRPVFRFLAQASPLTTRENHRLDRAHGNTVLIEEPRGGGEKLLALGMMAGIKLDKMDRSGMRADIKPSAKLAAKRFEPMFASSR